MNQEECIGMDVHQATISVAVMGAQASTMVRSGRSRARSPDNSDSSPMVS